MQSAFEFYRHLPVRPKRPERLFLALFPDTETSTHIGRLGEQFACKHDLEGTPLKTERLHVSLHHVGDYKRLQTKVVHTARQVGRAVSLHPFEMTFRFIKSFEAPPSIDGRQRKWPLVLFGEGTALLELHEILGAAMWKNGFRAAGHFMPHMTLLYGSKPIPAQAIEPIRFEVKEFVLVHSKLRLAQYDIIDRWSLDP